jgi:signal transduction histidine kinase
LQGNLAPLDLSQFCRELSEEFQFSSGSQYNICFLETQQGSAASDTANLPAALPYLDERLLRHILTNLLSNAIKYSPTGGNIILELIYCSDQLIFRVQDQGIGIPDSDQAHLFNSFHRGSNVSSIAGTGLGLSIVKQCVESLGGTISVESQVGAGSTFNVTLPLKQQKGKD